jgi:short-subunit dehydrogenase involved in D-alanine esterification of teichoic acids
MKLTGNTVLITGGTSGIGLALAKALLELDNQVILMGRNKKKLKDLKKLGFEVVTCDLNQQQEIEEASIYIQNNYPQLNMLFNNAGVQYNYDFTENVIPLDKITHEINVNVSGQMILTQLLIPLIANNNNAYIINTTSGLGGFPKSDALVYSASKAAMRNFTLGLRYSLKQRSIRVLEFIPPVTDTGMTAERDENKMPVEKLISHIIPQLRRDKKILTIPSMRVFLWIAFYFPSLANKILSKS